jgi:hypothetical protein
MTSATTATESNLRPAVLWFAGIYVGLSSLVSAVLVIFSLDGNSGVGIGVLVASIAAAAHKFVADHRRAMTRGEQLRFALIALAITLVITILQVVVVILATVSQAELPALLDEVHAWAVANAGFLSFAIVVTVLIYFAVLYFISGAFSRWFNKRRAAEAKA